MQNDAESSTDARQTLKMPKVPQRPCCQGQESKNVAPAAEPSKPIIPPLAPPSEAACGQQSATLEKLFVYTCPFCHGTVNSQVFGGKIDHRSACGHQFRVRNGEAVRQYEHVCPRCGTAIVSSKSSGRVQSQHRTPTGKACPQSAWIVRN